MDSSISKIPKFDDDEKKAVEKSILANISSHKKLESGKRFVLKHVVKDPIHVLDNSWSKSEEEEHFNAKWSIKVGDKDDKFGFYVCFQPTALVKDEYIDARLQFRIIGDEDYKTIRTTVRFFMTEEEEGEQGYYNFEEWNEIEYLLTGEDCDELNVEVEVEIIDMIGFGKTKIRDFGESQKELSDVILVVENTKFYVMKAFLALQSSYFKSLFFGKFNESEKNEIELKDIAADDFQNFLELIHGESSIDDDTVTGILQLADMYNAPTAIRRCEEFLLKNSEKTIVQKLQLALRSNLENLKNKCLSDVTTISHIESIMNADLPEMNLSISQVLLQKSIAFSKK
ncbi:unnamed protein product [Caenorhabditis nigoni]